LTSGTGGTWAPSLGESSSSSSRKSAARWKRPGPTNQRAKQQERMDTYPRESACANLHSLCFVRIVAPSSFQERLVLRRSYAESGSAWTTHWQQGASVGFDEPSGDMSSSSLLSSCTSPRGISFGRLKLVLRLELPLLERPGRFPVENEARRGEGGSIGDGEAGGR